MPPIPGSWPTGAQQGFQGGSTGVPPWYGGIGTGNNRLELAKRLLARLTQQSSPQMVARRQIKQPNYVAPAVPTLEELLAQIPAGYKPPQPGMSPAMNLINTSLGKQLYPGQGGQYWAYPQQAQAPQQIGGGMPPPVAPPPVPQPAPVLPGHPQAQTFPTQAAAMAFVNANPTQAGWNVIPLGNGQVAVYPNT